MKSSRRPRVQVLPETPVEGGPGRVTAIVARANRPGRFDVLVDGRAVGLASVDVLGRLGLREGVSFEPVREQFASEVGLLAVCDRAASMLAFRARSCVELRRQLLHKGEDPAQVDVAIERLRLSGYLDDADFARQFTRSRAARAGLSRGRVRQELARRGVAREIAERAVDEVFAEEGLDEGQALERVARKKLTTLSGLDARARRTRLYAFLARRGYSRDAVRVAVDALCTGAADQGSPLLTERRA